MIHVQPAVERVRFAHRATWLTVVGLVLVPLVVGGLLTWALWQPTDRLDRITAAVVNLDEPVEVDGQLVPLGRQLAAALVTGQTGADPSGGDAGSEAGDAPADEVPNVSGSDDPASFEWVLSDAADAAAGLLDGRYGAVVTIPATFSAAATSAAGDAADVVAATLRVETSPQARPVDGVIATAVAQAAAGLSGAELTEQYLSTVLVSFTTLHESLGQAAGGARELSDGVGQLAGGAGALADGAGALADGVGQAADGAGELSGGLGLLADGADDLADGLGQAAAQTTGAAAAAAAGVPQAQQFAAGLNQAASGVTAPGGLAAGATQLAGGAAGVSSGLTQLLDVLETQATACQGGDAVACATVLAIVQAQQGAALPDGSPSLTTAAAGVASGAAALDAGISTGTPERPALAPSLTTLAAGGTGLAEGASASASGLSTLAAGLGRLAAGAEELASGAHGSADGATQLADGVGEASGGASDLAGGASSLATGADTAAVGAGELADGLGEAVDQVPTYTEDEAATVAEVLAAPVRLEAGDGDLLGSSSVPFLLAVALWLGGLATFLVLTPTPRGALGSTRSSVELALSSFVPAASVGGAQGALLSAAMAFALELTPGGWVAFTAVAVLGGIAFAAVNQALAAMLGGAGRFVAMVVAVVALATGVISTVPGVLAGIAGLLPTAAALDGLRAVVQGSGTPGWAVTSLVLWLVVGLSVTTVAIARTRVVEIGRLARWARSA